MANPNQARGANGRWTSSVGSSRPTDKKREKLRAEEFTLQMQQDVTNFETRVAEHLAAKGRIQTPRDRIKWERKQLDLEDGLAASRSQLRNARQQQRKAR